MRPSGRGEPLCPSARPETPGARVFGVVDRSGSTPQVRYLREPVPIEDVPADLLQGAPAGEVWRIGARCAGAACGHFDGARCSLGERLVQLGPGARSTPAAGAPAGGSPVTHGETQRLPPCALRAAGCRWFLERGPRACLGCQWVVSEAAELAGSPETRERLAQPPRRQPPDALEAAQPPE